MQYTPEENGLISEEYAYLIGMFISSTKHIKSNIYLATNYQFLLKENNYLIYKKAMFQSPVEVCILNNFSEWED